MTAPLTQVLNHGWTLRRAGDDSEIAVSVPFDVHSALLDAGRIGDPYWRDRETDLDWVHQVEWILTREVDLDGESLGGTWTLTFDSIDCIVTVRVNGTLAGRLASQFLRHDLDVTGMLRPGGNRIEIVFHSNSAAAAEAAAQFPFALPGSTNCRIPHTQHLRKAACHAGWDWNIALLPLGVYGDIRLRQRADLRLDEIKVVQQHRDGRATVRVSAFAEGFATGEAEFSVTLCGQQVAGTVSTTPGPNRFEAEVEIDDPELWWPAGHGEQTLHPLVVRLGADEIGREIGLRQIELLTTPDEAGARFAFAVNGVEIFMRGANWIPADALPARITPERVRGLLQAARDVNMNMLRIWGGGQYEPEWFYDLCDRMGILIWQDFMFACNHYPAANRDWLALVRAEAHQQVRRLSSHPCLALWCGDNELVGALGWFEVTRASRDRYLANYTMLNHALEEAVESEAVDTPFWPSSPSSGRLNFGDAFHDDRSGDMHFWAVWHESKPFEHYRSVKPRFCSEFGFQSFPSMPTIASFTQPEDRNVSSPVMDVHQRNVGGNARIVETISRYFRFPDSFERMVYLSQVAQGLAMQTAIEFWRVLKPHCMGTLYWQLNDTWPVASWASLEFGGAWKVSHAMARRFYAPVLVTAQPDADSGETVILAVNDSSDEVPLSVTCSVIRLDGTETSQISAEARMPVDRSIEVARLPPEALDGETFLHLSWQGGRDGSAGEAVYFPERLKSYDLPRPTVTARWRPGSEGMELVLETDAPAFYVTVGLGGSAVWSDNAFALMPGRPRIIRSLSGPIDPDEIPAVQHLTGDVTGKRAS